MILRLQIHAPFIHLLEVRFRIGCVGIPVEPKERFADSGVYAQLSEFIKAGSRVLCEVALYRPEIICAYYGSAVYLVIIRVFEVIFNPVRSYVFQKCVKILVRRAQAEVGGIVPEYEPLHFIGILCILHCLVLRRVRIFSQRRINSAVSVPYRGTHVNAVLHHEFYRPVARLRVGFVIKSEKRFP